ncbi:unnamed protein product [Peniophora sp. CBMAI 1063]|nr:unnamed protein product [Peniophora sp. CBMAI 1063]
MALGDNFTWNWLVDETPTFCGARGQGPQELKVHWPGLNLRFFAAFPHLDVLHKPGQPPIRKRLKTWLNNHGRPGALALRYKPVNGVGPLHPAHNPQNMPAAVIADADVPPAPADTNPAPADALGLTLDAPPPAPMPANVSIATPTGELADGTLAHPPVEGPALAALPALSASLPAQPGQFDSGEPLHPVDDGTVPPGGADTNPASSAGKAAAATTTDMTITATTAAASPSTSPSTTRILVGPSTNGEQVSIIGTHVPVVDNTALKGKGRAGPRKRRTKKEDPFKMGRQKNAAEIYYDYYFDKVISDEANKTFDGVQDKWLQHTIAIGKALYAKAEPRVRQRCEAMAAGKPDPWGKPAGMHDEEYERIAKLERMEKLLTAAGPKFTKILDEFCSKLEGEAVASLFIAARQPSKGGEVQTFTWHTELPDGRNFTGLNNFRELVKDKHKEFGQAVFPSHLAPAWALPGTERTTVDAVAGPSRANSVGAFSRASSLAPRGRVAPSREQSLALECPENVHTDYSPPLPDSLPPTPSPLPSPLPFPTPETVAVQLPPIPIIAEEDIEMLTPDHAEGSSLEDDEGDWEDESDDEYPGIPKTRENGSRYSDVERKRMFNIDRNKGLLDALSLRHAASKMMAGVTSKTASGSKAAKNAKTNKPASSTPARPRSHPVPIRTIQTRRSGRVVSPSSPLVNEIVDGDVPVASTADGGNGKEDASNVEGAMDVDAETASSAHGTQAPSTPERSTASASTPGAPLTPNNLVVPTHAPISPTPAPRATSPVPRVTSPAPKLPVTGGSSLAGVTQRPQWFREYHTFMSDAMNGIGGESGPLANTQGAWGRVELFWEMSELSNGFELGKSAAYRLSTAGRPAVFQKWQSSGRRDKETNTLTIPDIEDLSAFTEEARQYWMSLQPAFRRPTDGSDWPPVIVANHGEIEFAQLRRYGTSGLLVVLLLILWWRNAITESDGRGRKEWVSFVEDVAWVLGEMMRTEKEFKAQVGEKRAAVEDATSSPATKRSRPLSRA